MTRDSKRLRAVQMLLLANACWALSFPGMKALALVQGPLLPGASSWFIASLSLVYRFAAAALILALVCRSTLRNLTALEVKEGLGLGVFAAAGLLLQMDGLAYTEASTSAFLTQFYCVLIPLIVAFQERRPPSPVVVLSVLLVLAGAAVLSKIDWRTLRIGRGEWETLAGSTIFTGQILWLQRPEFARNDVNHFTLVMFITIALGCAPVAALTTPQLVDWLRVYANAPSLALLVVMILFCTIGGYRLMNAWQPLVSATQAGLIYCAEPLLASLFAFFLPGWISVWAGIDYSNERLGTALLWGGALITLANVLINFQPQPKTQELEVT